MNFMVLLQCPEVQHFWLLLWLSEELLQRIGPGLLSCGKKMSNWLRWLSLKKQERLNGLKRLLRLVLSLLLLIGR